LQKVLALAIVYTEKEFPVSSVVSNFWKIAYKRYKEHTDEEVFKYWFEAFTFPKIGLCCPEKYGAYMNSINLCR